jgi:hypothetical protein
MCSVREVFYTFPNLELADTRSRCTKSGRRVGEVKLHAFVTSVLEGNEWPVSRPDNAPFRSGHSGGKNKNSNLAGNRNTVVQHEISHFTEILSRPTVIAKRARNL